MTSIPSILCQLLGVLIASQAAASPIARTDCRDTCGDVRIPFPFGIGPSCFLDSWFEIDCKLPSTPKSNSSAKPFLSRFNVEVVNIVVNSTFYRNVTVRVPLLEVCTADTQQHQLTSIDLRGSPFNFSVDYNSLVMKGCAGSAVVLDQADAFLVGCATVCRNNKSSAIPANKCTGVECCRRRLSDYDNWSFLPQLYQIDLHRQSSGRCITATLMQSDHVNAYARRLSTTPESSTVPLVLLWSWISDLPSDKNPYSKCERYGKTLACRCVYPLTGNPYISDGCEAPEECKKCPKSCDLGGDKYVCTDGAIIRFFSGFAFFYTWIGIVLGIGPLLIVFGCRWLYRVTKRRRKTERRVKFFKLMLQRHQASTEGVVESTKLFTHKELDKATDHFSDNRVLGKGGQGTVYKGMLTNGNIVAIKRSILLDESQMEQFINEVVILSQINHRNVVKLLGCCLETEVPLVVYEFISNGTLSQHIHHPDEDFVLGWAIRLKIAANSAEAIAYLHSSSTVPIYHRDIKSLNILLDEKYGAKVSDFGSSKTVSIDQTHLTTLVQGTLGYLDPEYFDSNQLTDKSDVYSFGVVLLELLTSKKPIYRNETTEQKNLVTEFFFHMQNSSLSTILDIEVVKDAKEGEVIAVADLAKCCLNGSGKMRPSMKEVAMVLHMIIESPANFTFNILEVITKDDK